MTSHSQTINVDLNSGDGISVGSYFESERFVLPLKPDTKFMLRVYPKGNITSDSVEIGCFLTRNDGAVVTSTLDVEVGDDGFRAVKVHKYNPTPSNVSIPAAALKSIKSKTLSVKIEFTPGEDIFIAPPALDEVDLKENDIPPPTPPSGRRRVLRAGRKIKNYTQDVSHALSREVIAGAVPGMYFESEPEDIPAHPDCSWFLRVYPNGIDNESEGNVAVGIVVQNAPNFNGNITFSAIGEGENVEVIVNEPVSGYYEYFVNNFLSHEKAERFVVDDNVTIHCSVNFTLA